MTRNMERKKNNESKNNFPNPPIRQLESSRSTHKFFPSLMFEIVVRYRSIIVRGYIAVPSSSVSRHISLFARKNYISHESLWQSSQITSLLWPYLNGIYRKSGKKNGARLPRRISLSFSFSYIILSRVPVNGPRPICLPCKQTEIGLEVVRLISRINPATGEEGRGGERKETEPLSSPLPFSPPSPLFNAMQPRRKNTFSILIKKKYCRRICITKISPRRVFLAPSPIPDIHIHRGDRPIWISRFLVARSWPPL